MQLTKPSWVNHDGNPIFSIDIHPDGLRFATGGQSKDSGRITIWNIAPVVNSVYEENENIPKMLCQLDNHLSCVNCVRWSHSGKFLASGGDDKLIMIWKKAGQTKLNENDVICSVEIWRCVGTLTGHSNDVLDLAWASHDSWLASCSIDNSIIVWNMDKIPEIVAKLNGHDGHVKGVTWDPIGQYLASQSDDRSLRIWRTKDWQEQACITEPFKDCGNMTHILRLHWSPDGQYLVSAHASNGGGPTARIIEIIERPIDDDKNSWSCEMDFVGHRKAVTCIRFNNNLLQKKTGADGSKQKYCALATGSRDCTLAIWCTAKKRPIVVINNIFKKAILDLSWSRDGMHLIACSWDGSVVHLQFHDEELGGIVSEIEKVKTLESLYGKSFATKHLNQTKIVPIMETPELLEFTPPTLSKPATAKPVTTTTTTTIAASAPIITTSVATAETPTTVTTTVTTTATPVEKEKVVTAEQPVVVKSEPTLPVVKVKQIETRTADGKRRVTPISLPRDVGDVQVVQTFSSSTESKTNIIIEQRAEVVEPNVTPTNSRSLGQDVVTVPPTQPVQQSPVNNHSHNTDVVAKAIKRASLVTAEVSTKRLATCEQMNQQNVRRCSHCENVLEPLVINRTGVIHVQGTDKNIEYENSRTTDVPCVVKMLSGSDSKTLDWQIVLNKTITCIKCNSSLTAITCKDSTLHLLNTETGSLLQLPVILPGQASYVSMTRKNYIAIITTRGYLMVWSSSDRKWIIRDYTFKHVLLSENEETPSSILSCTVTEDGVPTVSLSNGRCFSFSHELGWQLVSDFQSIVSRVSINNTLVHSSYNGVSESNLPVRSLQQYSRIPPGGTSQKSGLPKNLPTELCTAAFLQQQINATIALNSPVEYRIMLLTLVRFYAQEGCLKPLRVILEDLLGPHQSTCPDWKDVVLTHNKHDLLKEVLTAVKQHVVCQRLYVEFKDQLEAFDKQEQMEIS